MTHHWWGRSSKKRYFYALSGCLKRTIEKTNWSWEIHVASIAFTDQPECTMHMYNVLGKPSLVAYQLKSANFLSRTWDSVIRICCKFARSLGLTSILRNEGTLNDMAIDYIKLMFTTWWWPLLPSRLSSSPPSLPWWPPTPAPTAPPSSPLSLNGFRRRRVLPHNRLLFYGGFFP